MVDVSSVRVSELDASASAPTASMRRNTLRRGRRRIAGWSVEDGQWRLETQGGEGGVYILHLV